MHSSCNSCPLYYLFILLLWIVFFLWTVFINVHVYYNHLLVAPTIHIYTVINYFIFFFAQEKKDHTLNLILYTIKLLRKLSELILLIVMLCDELYTSNNF